jgi:16S rRNA (guanine527-N7)-methyltransferase
VEEILKWNRRYNLVGGGGAEAVVRHVMDSLAALPLLQRLGRVESVLEVGAGAGLPGIPLALLLPRLRFSLCDRSTTRCAFLRNVNLLLAPGNVRVLETDLKHIREQFDLVLFRAVARIDTLLDRLVPVLGDGGAVFAYKGTLANSVAELAALVLRFQHLRVYRLRIPGGKVERHIIIAEKRHLTG